jgi:hypothetical protein
VVLVKKATCCHRTVWGNGGSRARGSSAPEHNNLQETDFARNFPRLCGERTTSQSKRFLYFCVISSHLTKHGSGSQLNQLILDFVQTQSEFRGKFLFYSSFHGNHIIIRRDLVFPNSNTNGAFHQVYQSLLQILINV